MLTSYADDEALFTSIMPDAAGYVLKQVDMGDLLRAIRAVAAGHALLDPVMTASLLDRVRSPLRYEGDDDADGKKEAVPGRGGPRLEEGSACWQAGWCAGTSWP
jgi:DNA-binding NarL/FixJ family response regulator